MSSVNLLLADFSCIGKGEFNDLIETISMQYFMRLSQKERCRRKWERKALLAARQLSQANPEVINYGYK